MLQGVLHLKSGQDHICRMSYVGGEASDTCHALKHACLRLTCTVVYSLHNIKAGCVCIGGNDVSVFAGGSGVQWHIPCCSLPQGDDKTRPFKLVDIDVPIAQAAIWRLCAHDVGFFARSRWSLYCKRTN